MKLLPHERAFALGKARQVMEAHARNLRAAERLPYALGPKRGGTFVVCGAGPSLAAALPEVVRLGCGGATVCVVNTALHAFAGVYRPDVVLVREVVNVAEHLSHPAGLRVLDLGVHPEVLAAAERAGECAWFLGAANHTLDLAWHLGVRPLFAGTAALTALVALAAEWGAERVVLVGADLALGDDGASYSAGSAFAGQRAQIRDGVATNEGEGFARKQALHAASGLPLNPTEEDTIEVERWGGGTVRTTAQWIDQLPWLVDFAARHPEIECIDATGAGARKAGWREESAARVPWAANTRGRLPGPSTVPDFALARAALLAQCEAAIALAGTTTDPEGCVVAVPGLLRGFDLVEACAAGETLLAVEGQGPTVDRVRAVYSALSDAAVRLAEILRE